MIKVTIENYKSKYFPYKARWKINSVGYCAVFETVEQLKNYFIGRYIKVSFVERMD